MIVTKKCVDRAGNVAWYLVNSAGVRHVLRFTASQYRDDRANIARVLIRHRTQLRVVKP